MNISGGQLIKGTCSRLLCSLLFVCLMSFTGPVISAENNSAGQVMEGFTELSRDMEGSREVKEEKKHLILFSMGISLLVLLLATGGLGIAMAIYGKPVFVAHMVCSGLSITLALAHAVAAIIWFAPF